MKTILFLCPHHAAKSVIAAAYFNQIAQQHQLPFEAISAGTEPDEAVSPVVVQMLGAEGIDVSQHKPLRVTPEQLTEAETIISMGCTAEELGVSPERIEMWNDIPPISQDAPAAQAKIRTRVEALVNQLSE